MFLPAGDEDPYEHQEECGQGPRQAAQLQFLFGEYILHIAQILRAEAGRIVGMGGIVGIGLPQIGQRFPGLPLFGIQAAVALPHVHDHQAVAGRLGESHGLVVFGPGFAQFPLVYPGLAHIVMKNAVALVPAVFLENGAGLLVIIHGLRDGIHHVVQIADGAVQG